MLRDIEVVEAIKRDDLAYLLLLRSEKLINILPSDETNEMLMNHPTSLQIAAFYGAEKCYFYLRSTPKYIKIKEDLFQTIHFAAAGGNVNILNDLLSSGSNVNAPDPHKNTPLHIAAKYSHLNACHTLIENGANIGALNSEDSTPAHLAAANGRIDILKLFYQKGDRMKGINLIGWCPLFYAIKNVHKEAALFLVEKDCFNADIQTFTSLAQTAASVGLDDVVKALLEKGIQANELNHNFWGIIHFAAARGSSELIKYILDTYGINPFRELDRLNRSVAHIAAINGHLDVIKVFENTELIAMMQLHDKQGKTPFMHACQFGNIDIVQYFMKSINLEAKDQNGRTALMIAVENGKTEIIKLLVNGQININATDSQGKTALFIACELKKGDIAKFLLENKADPAVVPTNGMQLITTSIINKDEEMFNMLIEHNVPLTTKNAKGWSIAHYAAQKGVIFALEFILANESTKTLFASQNDEGKTPFGIAVFWNMHNAVTFMLENEVSNCNIRDKKGNIALHYACKFNHTDIAIDLINNSNSDLNAKNEDGMTPLLTAIESWADEITRELISKVICLANLPEKRGLTPLLLAAKLGQSHTVRLLVSEPRVRCDAESLDGMNAANYAAKQKDLITLAVLYKAGRTDLTKEHNGVVPIKLLEEETLDYYSDSYSYGYSEEEDYDFEEDYEYDDQNDDAGLPILLNSGEVFISRTNDNLLP